MTENEPCRVHYTLFDNSGFTEDLPPPLIWSSIQVRRFEFDDDLVYTQTAETIWNFDTFIPWIKRRSDDDFGWISFHSMDTDAIYSPYDGGADIFSLNDYFIAKIRTTFSAWRSPHPSGT